MTDNWKVQVSPKLGGNLTNVRAESVGELSETLTELLETGTAGEIAKFYVAMEDAYTLAGGLSEHRAAPAPAAAPADGHSRDVVAAPAPVAAGGAQRDVRDNWGNLWVYDHPQALPTPRGPAVLKVWTAQSGKETKRWFDPAKGPEWFAARKPKVPDHELWPGDFARGV